MRLMPRIAGDERTYAVRLCRHGKFHDHDDCPTCGGLLGKVLSVEDDGMGGYNVHIGAARKTIDHRFVVATEYGEDWISISTVAHILDKGGGLTGWAFNVAVAGVVKLIADGFDVHAATEEQLKAALKQAGSTPWVKKDRAASRGTEVHEALERIAKGESFDEVTKFIAGIHINDFSPEETHEVQMYAVAAVKWFVTEKPSAILVEQPVWSAIHRIVGTLDFLGMRPSRGSCLTDLKSSKDVYTDHAVQLDGYALCLREMVEHGVLDVAVPTRHTVVLARPDGSYEEVVVPSDPQGFLAALDLTRSAGRTEEVLKELKKKRAGAGTEGVNAKPAVPADNEPEIVPEAQKGDDSMSDEKGFRAIVKLNLPPDAEYQQGDSIILQADDLGQIDLMLTASETVMSPLLRRILDKLIGAPAPQSVVMSAPVVSAPMTADQAAAAIQGMTNAPPAQQQPVVVQPAPVPQTAPAPVAQPVVQQQPGTNPMVDGAQVGGTPGQRYPVTPGNGPLQLGQPCGKCGVTTYWQPPGQNHTTGQAFQGYYRCPNAKNHPKG